MPRNNKCNHPNCEGGPCKMLTPEEVTPREEDYALAKQLLQEGWVQVSAKFRHLKRWKPECRPPTLEEIIKPEYKKSWFVRHLMTRLSFMFDDHSIRLAPDDMTEEKTLTVREFKAFKDLQTRRWKRHLAELGENVRNNVPKKNFLIQAANGARLQEIFDEELKLTLRKMEELGVKAEVMGDEIVIDLPHGLSKEENFKLERAVSNVFWSFHKAVP